MIKQIDTLFIINQNNMKYQVTLKFECTFPILVEANSTEEAAQKARKLAENATMDDFILGLETDSSIEQLGV